MKDLLRNKGVIFILRFVVLFTVLYTINILFIGLTAPGGAAYSAFLDSHLNYIAGWRALILHSSNLLGHIFGLNSFVEDPFLLKTTEGARVRMVYSCIGYGITSFWLAFVLANEGSWQKKLLWCSVGAIAIFIINCFRVTLLLMAVENRWKAAWMDHHTMFNIVAYGLIMVLIYYFTKRKSSPTIVAG